VSWRCASGRTAPALMRFEQAIFVIGRRWIGFSKHISPMPVMHLARREPCDRSIDGPGHFIQDQCHRLLYAAWSRTCLFGKEAGRPDEFPLHHISTDEVYGSLGPTGQVSTEDIVHMTHAAPTPPRKPPATIWCALGVRLWPAICCTKIWAAITYGFFSKLSRKN